MHLTYLILISILAIVSCGSDQKQQPAAIDPSNPNAPESTPPATPQALNPETEGGSPESSPTAGEHSKGHASPTQPQEGTKPAVIYTCPMHPEVKQSKPGRCPKCGMDLVPQDPHQDHKNHK